MEGAWSRKEKGEKGVLGVGREEKAGLRGARCALWAMEGWRLPRAGEGWQEGRMPAAGMDAGNQQVVGARRASSGISGGCSPIRVGMVHFEPASCSRNTLDVWVRASDAKPLAGWVCGLLGWVSVTFCSNLGASLAAQKVKNLPLMRETPVRSLNREDPLEKGMDTHSIIFAWRIPWREEPGGLQSLELQKITTLLSY